MRTNVASLARRYFADFVARDRRGVDELLTDDFTFSSPRDDHIGKAKYFERCWPNGDKFRDIRIVKLVTDDDEAFVLYDCETKEGETFRNTELLRFAGEKLREIDVYFGRTL
jgi:hypothetical protein